MCPNCSQIQEWHFQHVWQCGPLVLESLLKEIWLGDEIEAFKQSLKIYIFIKFVCKSYHFKASYNLISAVNGVT